jgi:iron complex transport system substrate-binding protein
VRRFRQWIGGQRPPTPTLPHKGGGRRNCAVAALIALASCLQIGPASAKPQRIASIYLCSDQLLLRLADRERIVSVNRFAADTAFSNEAAMVKGIPLNRGLAEEILPLRPDLVIAGLFTAPATKALLRRLGIAVLELPIEEDFDGIRANIRLVARTLGEEERGEHLVAELDRSLEAAARRSSEDGGRPELMLYRFGGYSQGRNTLTNAIFERAGFANYAATRLGGVGRLALETIVTDPPAAILLGDAGTARDSLSAETLAHPAFHKLRATLPTLIVPDRLWLCGLANSGEAVRRLAAFRAGLPEASR